MPCRNNTSRSTGVARRSARNESGTYELNDRLRIGARAYPLCACSLSASLGESPIMSYADMSSTRRWLLGKLPQLLVTIKLEALRDGGLDAIYGDREGEGNLLSICS